MNEKWEFRYRVPQPGEGTPIEMTAEQAEKMLLGRLQDKNEDPHDVLWELARFYCAVNQYETALGYLRQIIASTEDLERKAACVLAMGQAMEQARNYPAAVKFYREAFGLEPMQTPTWYFISNNLGFCLNTLGNSQEGEKFCRAAIAINPDLPNGYKNLGISCAAQGQQREAAQCYVQATKVNATDGRSLRLLGELLGAHPELRGEFEAELQRCEQAVRIAQAAASRARTGQ